ncbi:MAG: hypothetical protein M3R52_05045 [Acidobacteriota bacterium]|nr:hypothetical protein [Acidobacteriota bacterium]
MKVVRLSYHVLVVALLAGSAFLIAARVSAQRLDPDLRPDIQRAIATQQNLGRKGRTNGYVPERVERLSAIRPVSLSIRGDGAASLSAPHPSEAANIPAMTSISAGTPLSRILHTSQLSLTSSAGTDEQFVDCTGDLIADERTTLDSAGGSFDIAVGRSGARYEVYSATLSNKHVGVVVVALDTNGDYRIDTSSTYNLQTDFSLPSAAAVVAGTSKAGREFVIVSSSGYYNSSNPNDPNNESSPGVILLVRDPNTGGFDTSRSGELVRVGDNRLYNANALALLPNNDLLIADFHSDELRIIRDTNSDGIPDTLATTPYYSYRFSNDAPLDIAVNSRGVVFSHSAGNDTVMLALYDDNADGLADRDEVVVEGLSIDNNLFLHGLTVDRAGNVYVIEDASGSADTTSSGGNGGRPRVDAFPDPALNGFLRDGPVFVSADDEKTQALSGLSFGSSNTLDTVAYLSLVNSAKFQGNATRDGLGSIIGTGLTRGASGSTESEVTARGLRVSVDGRTVPVFSFNDTRVNIYMPDEVGSGRHSVVVTIGDDVIAADEVNVTQSNPGIFTVPQNGVGEAVALLTSGARYSPGPFFATTNNQKSVIAVFGTGWRKDLPVTVRIGGRAAVVQYAGPSPNFPGLDQINVEIPEGLSGRSTIVVTTASGLMSRNDVVVTIR